MPKFVSWLTPRRAPGSRLTFQSPFRLAARLGLLALALGVVGESGHRVFLYLNATAAHHIFHIVFGGGAVVVFVVWVGIDIHRNGWPAYSWHLQPRPRRPAQAGVGLEVRAPPRPSRPPRSAG